MLVVVLPAFLSAGLAPEIRRDFRYDDAALGLAVAVFFAVSALAAPPAGRIVDRVGARVCVRVACTLTAAACVGVATLVESTAALLGMLALGGLGNALGTPAVSALLSRQVRREWSSRMLDAEGDALAPAAHLP